MRFANVGTIVRKLGYINSILGGPDDTDFEINIYQQYNQIVMMNINNDYENKEGTWYILKIKSKAFQNHNVEV